MLWMDVCVLLPCLTAAQESVQGRVNLGSLVLCTKSDKRDQGYWL